MKLTAAIAGSYPNAEVKHTNSAGYERLLKPKGIYEDSYIEGCHLRVLNTAEHNVYFLPFSDCQLLLTPLSEISDADAVEVAKMLNYRGDVDTSELLEYLKDVSNLRKVGDVFGNIDSKNIAENDISPMIILRCYDFLRASSWNGKPKASYDCGWGEIRSLIEAGMAENILLIGKK